MASNLSFHYIVERARLNRTTAQYVLKRFNRLPGMAQVDASRPTRRFSLHQRSKWRCAPTW